MSDLLIPLSPNHSPLSIDIFRLPMFNFCANLTHYLDLAFAAGYELGLGEIGGIYAIAQIETDISSSHSTKQMHPLASIQSGDLAVTGRIVTPLS